MRPFAVVTQTASPEAAVQPAPSTATRATTVLVAGSMRMTPSAPVAQIEPKAPTSPTAVGSGHFLTTLLRAGSMRSTSPAPFVVVQAAP